MYGFLTLSLVGLLWWCVQRWGQPLSAPGKAWHIGIRDSRCLFEICDWNPVGESPTRAKFSQQSGSESCIAVGVTWPMKRRQRASRPRD